MEIDEIIDFLEKKEINRFNQIEIKVREFGKFINLFDLEDNMNVNLLSHISEGKMFFDFKELVINIIRCLENEINILDNEIFKLNSKINNKEK